MPHPLGVGVQPVAEALVSDVDERNGTRTLKQVAHGLPFVGREVRAGRVVTAAMEQDHVTVVSGADTLAR